MFKFPKAVKYTLILLAAILIVHISLEKYFSKNQMEAGVTFSPRYAKYLKLDWQETFKKMLDETGVKKLRLPLYWEDIEKEEGKLDFTDADFMLSLTKEKGINVIAVLGIKQPRWPECHMPVWAKELTVSQRQEKTLRFIQAVVQKYKNNPSVWAWQIENEPMLGSFGEGCDLPDVNFLKSEADLVKNLSNKPIIMTDSGELGSWAAVMNLSDIFGTTVYRRVYNRWFGHVSYPIPAYLYNLKSVLIRKLFASGNQKTVIIELQAEPWLAGGKFVSVQEQSRLFSPEDFRSYIEFAKKTGFDEAYLWGGEWWYFMAENGYPQYLDFAKTLF